MKFSVTNKSWIVLSTAIIIGIVFSIYFLVYVKGKEKDAISNNFRVLQQVVKNIESLENSFLKNAEIRGITMSKTAETNQKLKPITDFQLLEADTLFAKEKKKILYGNKGLFFKVDTIRNPVDSAVWGGNYYFTDYDVFFDNELFQRKDIFEQVIIIKTNLSKDDIITNREVLYSNEQVGIMDSAFFQKTFRSAKDELSINDKRYISFNQKIHNDTNILISGLVLKSNFEQQKRSVSPFLIFTLSTALILIILAMPLLKLKIMSNEERLHSVDVVFAVISVLIGPAIFIVFLYTSLISFGVQKKYMRDNLNVLSHKIESNLKQEISQIMVQMDELNNYFSYVKDSSKIVGDSSFVLDEISEDILNHHFSEQSTDKENSNKIHGYKVYRDIINSELVSFKHLKLFFWNTEKAQALIFLSVFNNPGYAQNLSHRRYITDIVNDKPSIFQDLSHKNHKIAMESIKSVNDGSYEVGIGKSTEGTTLPVMSVSMKMASTMSAILEEGYGFCILDKEGNTMFHSDITKNMNENFISETQGIFGSAIESHTGMYKTVNYNGQDQIVFLRPLDCLSDHYIATFVNSEVQDAPFTLAMITAFMMFLCYLLLILLVSPMLYFSNFKLTKLRQNIKIFNFVRPYETEAFYKKYKQLIVVSVGVIGYLLFSISLNGDHYDFIISELILVVSVLLVSSLYLLSNGVHDQYLIHSGIRKPSKQGYSITLSVFLLFSLFRLSLIVYRIPDFWLIFNSLLGLAFLSIIVMDVFYGKNFINLSYIQKPSVKVSQVQKSYRLLLVLWVVIYSIIPINLFVQITVNKEEEVFSKYRSLNLINKIKAWNITSNREFRDKFDSTPQGKLNYETFVSSMAKDSINYALIDVEINHDFVDNAGYRDTYFDCFYAYLRPNYNDRSAVSKNYIPNVSSDETWIFKTTPVKNVLTQIPKFGEEASFISIEEPKVDFFMHNWPLILLIAIVSITILFSFMDFILIKIYGFNFKKYADRVGSINGKTFISYFLSDEFFSNNSSYNNIFIVGVNSAHLSFIKDYFRQNTRDTFLTLDFYDFSHSIDEESKSTSSYLEQLKLERFENDWGKIRSLLDNPDKKAYVLVEHFEFGYNDLRMNKLKLEVLKYLVDCENFKVLIKSEINATKLLDCYEDAIKRNEALMKKASVDKQVELQHTISDLVIDYKKWQHLLGSFVKCIIPMNKFDAENRILNQELSLNQKMTGTGKELVHGEFLDMLNKYIGGTQVLDLPDEDKILTIQQMSYPYYFSLWNSLSKEERFLVYDIAKDRFVNTVNSNAILSLLSKGILVYDHSLRLMNESFADFVLTKVNSQEALEMELEARKKGSWNTAFAVILLLIISLVIFLSIGQQNFLNDINSFLTAIAALIGLLIRFSGFLSFGGSKTSGA